MIGKIDKNPQLDLFKTPLIQIIRENHELVCLAHKIDWDKLEDELASFYNRDNGRPSLPIRTVASIILLKRIYDESDESVLDRWVENPYWQYFSGEVNFQHEPPFDRTELIKFRKRIGDRGASILLKVSIDLFPKKEIQEQEVLVDTTVQEKNITYPTDAKLHRKIIGYCWKISVSEGIRLRQSYKREVPQLMIDQRFHKHPRRRKKALKAARRLKTVAGRLVRDLERKMDVPALDCYRAELELYKKVLAQTRSGSNKIYSLHQPHVRCIAKGKEAKKFEFGNKTSIVKTARSGIIVGAIAFADNLYDGDTLKPQLEQVELLTGRRPKVAVVDRGYRGRKNVDGTEIEYPKPLPKTATNYQKHKKRKRFRARAGIEPIIGHLKQDHRMSRNYLLDEVGDKLNTILAATGFNLKKMLQRLKAGASKLLVGIIFLLFPKYWILMRV